jgi:hypothetical protein
MLKGPAVTMMLSSAVAFWGVDAASDIFAVKLKVPAVAAVPEINPLPLKLKPAGKVPEVILQV